MRFIATLCLMLACSPIMAGTFDWRNVNGGDYTTPVKNQLDTGSCYDFAAIATFESKIEIATHNPNLNPDLSEQHILSSRCCGNLDGGWDVDVLDFFVKHGVTDEKTLPFVGRNQPTNWPLPANAPLYKVTSVSFLLGNGYLDGGYKTQEVKDAIEFYGPLSCVINVPNDWYRGYDLPNWPLAGTSYDHNYQGLRHAVSVVGYMDDPGVYIVKNSWGDSWGDHGFGFVPYGALEARIGIHLITGDVVLPQVPEPNTLVLLLACLPLAYIRR